jgi:UDP-N-acetyl-D-galactosamine dehydrogenase
MPSQCNTNSIRRTSAYNVTERSVVPTRYDSDQPLNKKPRADVSSVPSPLARKNAVLDLHNCRVAVVGLGYVGLPLAVEFGKRYMTVGFDLKARRIAELRKGHDTTLEVTTDELRSVTQLTFTTDPSALRDCRVFIVTVPTPIDEFKRPDLTALTSASESVGKALKKGDIVIYESTVYPGCTEEICVPILERISALRLNRDFFVGYSPERVNPGDKQHRLTEIKKVTSGSTPKAAEFVDALYRSIITAGTHPASSIRVAEAAKVIENTQRDVNIALINELALIFNRLGIDTEEVLNAAGSKWNFLPFRPGLVGGHCIGVDPYYLTHKAQQIGYHPEMILAGRRLNDNMPIHVVAEIVKLMTLKRIHIKGSRALVLGLTFKENCPDIRNSKVVDVVREMRKFGAKVDVYDPWADSAECLHEYGIRPVRSLSPAKYDVAVIAVAHREFRTLGAAAVRKLCRNTHVLYDIKHVFTAKEVDGRL